MLVTFVSKLAHKVNTLTKEYVDGIITNIRKNDNFPKKNLKDLEKLQSFHDKNSDREEIKSLKKEQMIYVKDSEDKNQEEIKSSIKEKKTLTL